MATSDAQDEALRWVEAVAVPALTNVCESLKNRGLDATCSVRTGSGGAKNRVTFAFTSHGGGGAYDLELVVEDSPGGHIRVIETTNGSTTQLVVTPDELDATTLTDRARNGVVEAAEE